MHFRSALLAAFVALAVPAALAEGEEVRSPVVRGQLMHDFARLSFDWPEETRITTDQRGTTLTLRFNRTVQLDMGNALDVLSPYVTRARPAPDGKALVLSLRKPYRVRSFVSDLRGGVDFLEPPAKAEAALASALAPAAGETAETAEVAEAAEKEKAVPAHEQAAPKEPKESATKEAPSAPEPTKDLSKESAPSTQEPAVPAMEPPAAPSLAAPTPAAPSGAVKVFASEAGGRTVLRFAWQERTAAAVFVRRNWLWVVFNTRTSLDLNALQETAAKLLPRLSPMDVPGATVLRVRLPESNMSASASRAADSQEWSVVITSTPQQPSAPLRVDTNTEPPLPPHLFLPALEAAEALTVQDPEAGDTLTVLPLYTPGQGIAMRRDFVECALLATAQGVVMRAAADGVKLIPVLNGYRISTEHGLSLTPHLSMPASPVTSAPGEALPTREDSMFPYDKWKAAPLSYDDALHERYARISIASDGASMLKARVHLAQLMLAEGMAADALGVVQEIRRRDPAFFIAERVSALSGAAQFMLYRFTESSQDFATPELAGSREAGYWRAMLSELLGAGAQDYDFLAAYQGFLQAYPPSIKQRLAIVAADKAITSSNYNVALQIFDLLKKEHLLEGIDDYAQFLMARIAVESGREKAGLAVWRRLAKHYRNPFVRARAEFALIREDVKSKHIDTEETIARLERLRLTWRGDALELETLKWLAELYMQQQQPAQALRTWRVLVEGFNGSAPAAEAVSKMNAAFSDLFDRGMVGDMKVLDQLALYYEFRALTPAGESGDRIVHRLADRLVDMDLLPQAIALLDYRMRYVYERDLRSRTGAKLARVYLLNKEPDKALAALEASTYGSNPEDLRQERDRTAARAMVELARYEEAMRVIAADASPEAEQVRQLGYWRQKDWPSLIHSVEAMLKARPNPAEAATAQETDALIRLALAYNATGDMAQLQYLRDYFMPLVKDPTRTRLFAFVTEPDVPLSPATFDALVARMEETQKFLGEYQVVAKAESTPATPPVKEGAPTP